ncbi:MAG: methyltransferase domain-containing protein [Anaerolineaceae bacterium]|nr:methyltransferase domain-containing protein [Anaerolineaceae bacterium]
MKAPRKRRIPARTKGPARPKAAPSRRTAGPAPFVCEVDVAEGLERFAWDELDGLFEERVEQIDGSSTPGRIRFQYVGNLYHLTRLQTVQAVYLSQVFAIPRPKALLGDQHFRALLAQIAAVRDLSPADAYQTFYLSAAGSESSVLGRLRDALAEHTGLTPSTEEGDLLIRLRHPPEDKDHWETLVRLSPRPLATRSWRVCNREGALNAAVAQVMVRLTRPKPEDAFLNIGCGSGTLLIERLACAPAVSVSGYDHDATALTCAEQNAAAAGFGEQIKLNLGDARKLPLTAKSVDAICADLPFGHMIGSHEGNIELYPALLAEVGRVAKPGARFVLITHEVRLMETLLEESPTWHIVEVIRVALGGLYPRIFVLERKGIIE